MSEIKLANLFLEYSDDIIWMIDSNFSLVYANQTFQNVMKQVHGKKIKIGESVFTKDLSEAEIEKWKAYYERGFNGEHFEVVDHFYNPKTNNTQYIQLTFKPAVNKDGTIDKIACQSRDITSFIKSNDEAEKLLDASLDVICSIDEHGIFTNVSAACKELWGYEKQELIGKPYISFVIEEDIENTNQTASDIIDGIAKTTFENRYKRKDGGIAFNLWSARYDPKIKTMFCVARDAREKIKNQKLLIESEQRFKALVQGSADMISIIDAAGNYMYTSPTTTEILGITPAEFDGNSVFDFIHPDDIERSAEYIQRIRTENKVVVEPFRLKDGNNEWRWIETVLTNMLDNPSVRGIVANSRDITDRKKETQHLKLLESVITNTKDSVLITEAEPFDLPGPRILYVNEAFTRMTGYTAEEVIGKTPRILQGPKSDRAELARLSKAMRNWESCEITTVNYKKNGEEFWINFSLTPVADETGWYTHWIAIERDVTEQKNLEIANHLTTKISTIFNEEVDLHGALTKLCEEVAVMGFFSFCEIWLTNIQENLLELKTVYKRDKAANIFYENSKRTHFFEKGQGVPGRVWENGDAIIWENKGKNNESLFRAAAAEKARIKTVVGFPLIFHDKIIGVLQFGAQSNLKTLEWITNILSNLSVFIGAEIGRKKTENDLTRIFEFAPDIIATCGFDGFFKTVNPYTTELFGYTEKEFTSKPLTAFLHPDDAQITANALEKLTFGEPIYNFKNRYITKSGDIKTLSWNCSPVVEDELFFFIGKDITEEVKVTNLLKDSNQMSRIGSWEVDLINNSLFWSDITYQIHETPKSFIPQMAEAINFYREDFREQVTKAVSTCIQVGTPVDLEAVIITANNNEVWVRAMGKAEIINGVCVRIYGSFQDIHERKVNDLELRKSLKTIEHYKFSLDQSAIVAFTDSKGVISYVNNKFCEISQYSKEELVGKTHQIINSKHHPKEFFVDLWKTISSGKVWRGEVKNAAKDGSYYWVDTTIVPFLDENKKPLQYLAVRFDVTDRKAIEEQKNSLLTTLENSLNEIYIFDAKTLKFSYVNQSALVNLGYSEQEMNGLTPLDIKPEFTATAFNQQVNSLVTKEKEKIVFFTNHQRKNGSLYPVEIHLQFISEGNNKRFLAVILDITERKKEESKLIESENYLRTILDNEPECVKVVNSKGELLSMNPAGLAMIEADNEQQVLGHRLTDWIHKEYKFGFNRLCNEVFKGDSRTFEFEITGLKGGYRWLETHAVPLKDAKGKVVNLLGVTRDITDRKKAQEELLNAFEQRKNILESIGDAFFAVDKDWNVTYWNRIAENILGKKREDILGKNYWKEFADTIRSDFYLKLHHALETKEMVSFEYHYKTSNHWLEVTASPSEDGLSVFLKDITQRKKANEEIAKSEEKRRLIMNGALDAIVSIDTNETINFWNPQAEVIFGWKAEEVMGKPLSEVIIPEPFRKYHVEGLKNYLKTGEGKALNVLLELSAIRRNKEEFPIELTVIPIKQGDEEFFCAFIRDITKRKKAEKEIKLANDRFEKVTEATNDVIWDWDIESGTFIRSIGIDHFFGVGASKVLDKKDFWKDNFHEEDLSKIKSSLQKALEDPDCKRWEEEYRILNHNNEIIFVIDRGLIIRNKNGKAIRMVGAMSDISEIKHHEVELVTINQKLNIQSKELQRSNEELEQFAFIASHDLQEPLRMISSFMDLLKRKYGERLDEKGLQYIHFATDGAKRMKQIILDLLLYSRANKTTEENELINLNEIVSEYTQLRRKVIAEKSASITNHGLPSIETYRAPISQIFHCLLDNALKYVDDNKPPHIEISAIEKENVWQFAIKDNGIGIDSKFFDKIFIIFQRLQNRKDQDGTGIGLAVAKRSIEFLGGEVWLESELGKGTTFYFSLLKIKQLL